MKRGPQWKVEIHINAPVAKVWDAIEDLTRIPQYHPDVRSVEYLSGQTKRAPGVTYKCVVPEGRKGWCVERVVENIPNRKTSVMRRISPRPMIPAIKRLPTPFSEPLTLDPYAGKKERGRHGFQVTHSSLM